MASVGLWRTVHLAVSGIAVAAVLGRRAQGHIPALGDYVFDHRAVLYALTTPLFPFVYRKQSAAGAAVLGLLFLVSGWLEFIEPKYRAGVFGWIAQEHDDYMQRYFVLWLSTELPKQLGQSAFMCVMVFVAAMMLTRHGGRPLEEEQQSSSEAKPSKDAPSLDTAERERRRRAALEQKQIEMERIARARQEKLRKKRFDEEEIQRGVPLELIAAMHREQGTRTSHSERVDAEEQVVPAVSSEELQRLREEQGTLRSELEQADKELREVRGHLQQLRKSRALMVRQMQFGGRGEGNNQEQVRLAREISELTPKIKDSEEIQASCIEKRDALFKKLSSMPKLPRQFDAGKGADKSE